jgi:hypothetical protein
MSLRLLAAAVAISGALVPVPASAGPTASISRAVEINGKFLQDTTTYSVRVTYRERVVAGIGDPMNPSGLLVLNPSERAYFVKICEAAGCDASGSTLCSSTTPGIVSDNYQTISVDSTATDCPVSFNATVSGYGVPYITGLVNLNWEANAVFQPGATIFTRSAIGSNGRVIRTLVGVGATT